MGLTAKKKNENSDGEAFGQVNSYSRKEICPSFTNVNADHSCRSLTS